MAHDRGAVAQASALGPEPEQAAYRAEFARLMDGLGRIHGRLRAVTQTSGLSHEARFEPLVMLDDQARDICLRLGRAQPLIRQLGHDDVRQFLGQGRDLFGLFLDAFGACLVEADSSSLGRPMWHRADDCRVRMARAAADRVIWERFAGGPAHPNLWRWLGSLFDSSVRGRKASAVAMFGPVGHCATSVEREFLRALAAQSAALELATPSLILPIGRLLNFVLPMLRFDASPFTGALFSVAPGDGTAPRRLVGAVAGEGVWYFAPGLAVGSLIEVEARIPAGDVPARLSCGEPAEMSLRSAISHLVRHWSAAPPVRRHRRHLLEGKLTAVRGLAQLKAVLSGQSGAKEMVWSLRDVSRGGLGAYAPPGAAGDVRVGDLVAFRAVTGAGWQIALVRRSWAGTPNERIVGLETISQRPMRATVDDGRIRTEVVLCDPVLRGEAVRLASERGAIAPDVPLFLTDVGGIQKLKPLEATMTGEGFELRVYQVL